MILVYAGRRIDPDEPDAPRRFPAANVPRVSREVGALLRDRRPSAVVGSAACGADLLVLDAAERLGIRRRVILPFDRDTFRATSVADRPGDWGALFDAVLRGVIAEGDLVELSLQPGQRGTYLAANTALFTEGDALARTAGDACAALVLWNGAARGEGDVTGAFLTEVRRRGWPATEIDTARDD